MQRQELILVTPEMAREMLTKNTSNRLISKAVVSAYAEEMKEGTWSLNHQGIAFYESGALADGQHRLLGVVQSGVSIWVYVTYGLENGLNIDQHRKRRVDDSIKIAGVCDFMSRDVSTVEHVRPIKVKDPGDPAEIKYESVKVTCPKCRDKRQARIVKGGCRWLMCDNCKVNIRKIEYERSDNDARI